MADTSLWPIVLTGLFTLVGSLGGIGIGLVGSARRDAAQQRHEKSKRRDDKLEELVTAVYDFDHWLVRIRDREAVGVHTDAPQTVSPFAKVESITSIYFPQFIDLVDQLDHAAIGYLIWIQNDRQKRLAVLLAEMMSKDPAGPPQKAVFTKMPSIDPLILNEAGYPEGNLDEYEEASGPYIEKQRELLVALSEFAREEFQ